MSYTPMRGAMVLVAKELLRLETAEDPPGSNRGEIVSRILRSEGVAPGEPWCNAFWRHVYHIAADFTATPYLYGKGGSTAELVSEAVAKHRVTTTPGPGDACCFKGNAYNTGYEHTGMFLEWVVKGESYRAIEGNVGNAVTLVTHNISRPVTFVSAE